MMHFTFLHRKAIAHTTLVAVILVLLLALNFTVFSVSYCQNDVTDQILTAAADIGEAVSVGSAIKHAAKPQCHQITALPAADISVFHGRTGLFWLLLLFALLLCAFCGIRQKATTPVTLCVRMDR